MWLIIQETAITLKSVKNVKRRLGALENVTFLFYLFSHFDINLKIIKANKFVFQIAPSYLNYPYLEERNVKK